MVENIFEDRARPLKYIIVPIAQYSETLTSKAIVTYFARCCIEMLSAINLDDDFSLKANKVQNEALNRRLAPKLELSKAPTSQQSPHLGFGVRRIAP